MRGRRWDSDREREREGGEVARERRREEEGMRQSKNDVDRCRVE